jgi:hypothetical protein
MLRSSLLLASSVAAFGLALTAERDAAACGGCFHPPTQTASDITDERMLLSVSPTQTTLYDQLQYTGSPTSFAWVLPTHGTVTIGLSANVLFDSVDLLTTTQIVSPQVSCPGPPADCLANGGSGGAAGGGLAAGADASAPAAPPVVVTAQENVGPYATVQLHSTDPGALNTWLTQNGFSVPASVTPVIDEYVTEGFDFLAMKLLPNQGVQAMRPVRVTMPGASLSLPLRMAAVGTGASVGVTIWVVSEGRYEPQNFPFFHIEDSALIWDFKTSSSNYTTLRAQNEAALGGKGWEIESSLDLNEQLIQSVILSGGQYYGTGYVPAPIDASQNYLSIGDADGGADDGGAASQSAEQVRADDVAALFAGMQGPTVRVTRMRSDISHAAMTTDFVLQASSDQLELSNVRQVTESINLQCPVYSNCSVVGTSTPGQGGGSGDPTAPSGSSGSSGSGSGGDGSNGSAGGGGCETSARTTEGSALGFGSFGLLGLVAVARLSRTRRRRRG